MRSPSTQPWSIQWRISSCDRAKISGNSTRIPARRGDREEPPVVQLGVGPAVIHQLVVLPGVHLPRGAVAGAVGDREGVVVVAQFAVHDGQRIEFVVPVGGVAQHRQPDLAAAEFPVDVERLRVFRLAVRGAARPTTRRRACGVATPTWLGTMSTITPIPAARAAVGDRGETRSPAARSVGHRVIGDVVPVRGTGFGLQQRRQVHPVHAERGELRHQRRGVGQPPVLGHLQPIRRVGDLHDCLPCRRCSPACSGLVLLGTTGARRLGLHRCRLGRRRRLSTLIGPG